MNRHLKKQLKDLKSIAPSQSWLSAHRDLLLSQTRSQNSQSSMAKISVRERVRTAFFVLETIFTSTASAVYARGLASLALAAVLFLASGGYIVTASEGSVPGDSLYGLKIAVENLRLKMATSSKNKVELQVEFASRRLEELSKLTANGSHRLPEAETLVSQFETSVKDISATANQASSGSADKAVEIAKIVNDKVGEYENSLKATSETAKSANISKRVNRAISVVNRAGTEALKIIVSKDTSPDSDKIADKINDKIKQAEDKLSLAEVKIEGGAKSTDNSEMKDKSADARTNIAEAKKKVTEGDYQAALVILDKIEDMVAEVADSAETVVEDQPEAGPPGAGNTGSGTQNTEGEVKGENTSTDDESGQSVNPAGSTGDSAAKN